MNPHESGFKQFRLTPSAGQSFLIAANLAPLFFSPPHLKHPEHIMYTVHSQKQR